MSPTLFCFFKTILPILDFMTFHINFRISLSVSIKKPCCILIGIALSAINLELKCFYIYEIILSSGKPW